VVIDLSTISPCDLTDLAADNLVIQANRIEDLALARANLTDTTIAGLDTTGLGSGRDIFTERMVSRADTIGGLEIISHHNRVIYPLK
jgi:hypothetical protein